MVHPHDNFVVLFAPLVIGSRVHLATTTGSEGRGLRTGADSVSKPCRRLLLSATRIATHMIYVGIWIRA